MIFGFFCISGAQQEQAQEQARPIINSCAPPMRIISTDALYSPLPAVAASVFVLLYQQPRQYLCYCTNQPPALSVW